MKPSEVIFLLLRLFSTITYTLRSLLPVHSNNPDRALISAFKKMGEICEMMQLVRTQERVCC